MSSPEPAALDGVRVLDFTWSVAGPTATRILAALGAEVIKVEWAGRPDQMRFALYAPDEKRYGLDNGVFFADNNSGKRSLCVDARSEAGFALLGDLVRRSDFVTESFSASVFDRWGFTYERLRELREDVIVMSVSGFGHGGRYSDRDCWGPTAQAFNGLTYMSGLPGSPPAGWGWSYMDLVAGYSAAVAALAALVHRRRTGEGQYIDVSQVETGIPFSGPEILDRTVNGEDTRRPGFPPGSRAVWSDRSRSGGRGEVGAPYGVYATKGGGRNDYCAITVLDEAQWAELRAAMGDPDWAADPEFATLPARLEAQDALDARVERWTLGLDKYECMELLQSRGVPCGAVQSAEDRMEHDPQLRQRSIFPALEHPVLGRHRFQGIPFQLAATPIAIEERWPSMGADNEYVLREILELDQERIDELEAEGVLWPADLPRDPVFARALW